MKKSLITKKTEKEFLKWQSELIIKIITRRNIPTHRQQDFTIKWIEVNALRVREQYFSKGNYG